jgi:hypothetical protein
LTCDELQDTLVAVAPCLRGQKLLLEQCCYLPSSADNLPVIGAAALAVDLPTNAFCLHAPVRLSCFVQDRCRICLELS